ncbi:MULTISPECIES: alpha/beta fold hydrolase [unclassified Sphingomonas]|uniref:alpha/beta fold hydrolase n=1 Tax=unclassified Sphingomonas TaxID=196159 RepID=UPI0035A89A3D
MTADHDVGDGTIHVAVAGGETTIVLLHGWTLDHRSWTPQLPLAAKARLVMVDRRGFGRSTAPAHLASEWQDIDRIAGTDRFVLVGMSQGASVALDYARHRPDRLSALMLAGAPLHGVVPVDNDEGVMPRDRYAALMAAGQLSVVRADWAQNALVRTKASGWPLMNAMLGDYDGRDLCGVPSSISITADDIAALPMPVLAVAGVRDTRWRRRVSAFIGQTAPHGRTVSIDDAGHLCNIDNPAQFNALLADLIGNPAVTPLQ